MTSQKAGCSCVADRSEIFAGQPDTLHQRLSPGSSVAGIRRKCIYIVLCINLSSDSLEPQCGLELHGITILVEAVQQTLFKQPEDDLIG